MSFKVGDQVRVVSERPPGSWWTKNMDKVLGKVGVVSRERPNGWIAVTIPGELFHFSYRKEWLSPCNPSDEVHTMSYKFNIKHESQIDFEEIQSELSYKKPLAFITRKDKEGHERFYGVVSKALLHVREHKDLDGLQFSNILPWEEFPDPSYFADLKSKVEQIKAAPWVESKNEVVEVVIPNV